MRQALVLQFRRLGYQVPDVVLFFVYRKIPLYRTSLYKTPTAQKVKFSIKDRINPYNCLLKSANFKIETRND